MSFCLTGMFEMELKPCHEIKCPYCQTLMTMQHNEESIWFLQCSDCGSRSPAVVRDPYRAAKIALNRPAEDALQKRVQELADENRRLVESLMVVWDKAQIAPELNMDDFSHDEVELLNGCMASIFLLLSELDLLAELKGE